MTNMETIQELLRHIRADAELCMIITGTCAERLEQDIKKEGGERISPPRFIFNYLIAALALAREFSFPNIASVATISAPQSLPVTAALIAHIVNLGL